MVIVALASVLFAAMLWDDAPWRLGKGYSFIFAVAGFVLLTIKPPFPDMPRDPIMPVLGVLYLGAALFFWIKREKA